MTKICYLCKKGEIVHDKKMSGMFCTGCGECFELGAFTDEVQYREDERGRYKAVGTTYNVEKGFVNSKFSNHAQFLSSVDNAKTILKRYCDKLYISDSFAQISSGFYHQLLIKKFTNGRRLNVVLAACLYIAVRSEGANVILLDISDVSEANVYDIGRYYFQIIRLLHFNIQKVDPCEYIVRFVDMLNLGDRNLSQVKRTALCVRDTANRLVQRMKRDWIHFGRRPSGVCAAAVLVSARINHVRCSIKDIISIAKICESTLRKRIKEFTETPSSKLTYKEFMEKDLDEEEDPPSYKYSLKDTVEANLDKVEKYQEIIEEHLKDSRTKLRGVYAKFLKNIFTAQEGAEEDKPKVDDENSIIQETIIDQNILALDDNIVAKSSHDTKLIDDNGNPSAEEIQHWLECRPSAKSLGLLRKGQSEQEAKIDYEDLLDANLDDRDDDELDAYLVQDPNEINRRQLEWSILNKDYLEKEEKESLKRLQKDEEDDEKSVSSKTSSNSRNKKKRKKIEKGKIEASSASEAVEAACKAKSISLNMNLKELFNETSSSSSTLIDSQDLHADKPRPPSILETVDNNNDDDYSSSLPTSDNKEDAHLVNLYHSYALKSPMLKPDEDRGEMVKMKSETSLFDNIDDVEIPNRTIPNMDAFKFSQNTTSSSIKDDLIDDMDDHDQDHDVDDDDYFDDEDDELRKIKLKYSIQNDDLIDVSGDEIEDCGF